MKKLEIDVKWEEDVDADLDWIGFYTNSIGKHTVYIDRKHHVFVNEKKVIKLRFNNQDDANEAFDKLDEFGVYFDSYEDNETYNYTTYIVAHFDYVELDFGSGYCRNQYQYFISDNLDDPKSEDDYKYFISNFKLMQDYGDSWYMRGCIVTASVDGFELGQASLWGLDSTMSKEDDDSVIEDLTYEAKAEALKRIDSLLGMDLKKEEL